MVDFIYISRYAGMREDLVQAAGGNSSVKLDDQTLRVKASGVPLADITDKYGFVDVNRDDFSILSGTGRPSIETILHLLTPERYTLHTHPTVVNMLLTTQCGISTLRELFPESTMIGYAPPGEELAKLLVDANPDYSRPVFLKNHGLIVCGEVANDIITQTEFVVNTVAKYLKIDNSAFRNATELAKHTDKAVVYLCRNSVLENVAKYGEFRFDFCPDCIVYCRDAIRLYNGHFYVFTDTIKRAKEIESVLAFAAEIAMYNCGKQIDYMSSDEQLSLINRDDEKYRKNLR